VSDNPFTPTTPDVATMRLAVAQTTLWEDPGDLAAFRAAGDEVLALMADAKDQGADLIQFPESTLCLPAKRSLSSERERMAEADWTRFAWSALAEELDRVAEAAARLGLWTVVGAQHRGLGPRPRTGLVMIDDHGTTVARYHERALSPTKSAYLYAAGEHPVVVEVRGIKVGLASGVEGLFAAVFEGYADAGADLVLFSTAGVTGAGQYESLVAQALAHARGNLMWLGLSTTSNNAPDAPSGIARSGHWMAQCPKRPAPALVVTEVSTVIRGSAHAWHRAARHHLASH
jgi:predicted amidohydrolase